MRLRWNFDGKGKRAVPPRLLSFARAKRLEFLRAGGYSAMGGLLLGRLAALWSGNADALSATVAVESAIVLTVALVLGLGISAVS